MRGNRPLALGGVLVFGCVFVWWVLFGFGVARVLFPHHVVFPSPSMMTWALRPHGVRTRGKKRILTSREDMSRCWFRFSCLGGWFVLWLFWCWCSGLGRLGFYGSYPLICLLEFI